MAKSSVTLKSLRALAVAGRSDKLNAAIAAGFESNNTKLQTLAVALAAELGIALPFDALLVLTRKPADLDDAERLGAALRLHQDDNAVESMVGVLRSMTPAEWTGSMAAVGHALRGVANPRATDMLLSLVRESAGETRDRALWALRGRRPRDPRAAALGVEIGANDGRLLRLGQDDPDALFDLVEEGVEGRIAAVSFTLRPDAVAAWLSSLSKRTLAGDADARARLIAVAESPKSLSMFQKLWKEDLFSPSLVALVEGGDAALVEAVCELATWLPLEGVGLARLFDAALARVRRGEVLDSRLGRLLHHHRSVAAIPILVDVMAGRDAAQADAAAWALEGQQPVRAHAALDAALQKSLGETERARVKGLRDTLADRLPGNDSAAFVRALEAHALEDIRELQEKGADANHDFTDATGEQTGVRPLHFLLRDWKLAETEAVAAAVRVLVAAGADIQAKVQRRVDFDEGDYGGEKFDKGETPAILAMRNLPMLGRPAVEQVLAAVGVHPSDAYLAALGSAG